LKFFNLAPVVEIDSDYLRTVENDGVSEAIVVLQVLAGLVVAHPAAVVSRAEDVCGIQGIALSEATTVTLSFCLCQSVRVARLG